jgi:ABC-2 type transport system permease protein
MTVLARRPVATRGEVAVPAPMRRPWLRIAAYAVRRRRRAPLAWGLPLGLMSLMVVAVFPSIEGSAQLDDLMRSYPEAFKEAFGVTDASFQSIQGYLAAEVFNLIGPFATAFFMIHALATGICGTERSGVMDVLLSAPLARRTVMAGWLAGSAVVLLAILAFLGVLVQAGALVFGADLAPEDTLAGVLNLWPLSIFFAGVAALVAGVSGRAVVVTGVGAGVLALMYFVEVLGSFSDTIAAIDGLSAFHYYGSAIERGIDPVHAAGLVASGLALTAVGCMLFERRDVGR